MRGSSVRLVPEPCHSRPSKNIAVPAGASIGTTSSSRYRPGFGCRPLRWLPGTTRVAPLSSWKSTSSHMLFRAAGGAIMAALSRTSPASARVIDPTGRPNRPLGTGGGIHHASVCSSMGAAPLPMMLAVLQESW